MVAKMILPFLGGAPAVWNTSLFFFQLVLLAGYIYAHFASSWLGIQRHALLHLGIVFSALFVLPIAVPADWFVSSSDAEPVKLVLSILFAVIGLPFFVLAAGSPLLQKWFSSTDHSAAGDPYFLYAASNLGSMIGVLAYPFFLEPYFKLPEQSWVWFLGYLGLLLLTTACVVSLLSAKDGVRQGPAKGKSVSRPQSQVATSSPMSLRRARWVLLSFAPSSLLLGVTNYVTTDLASAPLFWIGPLALYLLSFVLAFATQSAAVHAFTVRRQAFLLSAAAVTFLAKATNPLWILVPLHVLAFFVTALVCHGELAKDRPKASLLTEFYVWISIGGVLGGCFNTLIAPVVFRGTEEYPLAMVAAALVRPYLDQNQRLPLKRWLDVLLPCGFGVTIVALVLVSQGSIVVPLRIAHIAVFGVSGVVCLAFAYRPIRFGLGIAAALLACSLYTGPFGDALRADRSFFGVYRTVVDSDGKFHYLLHGTTVHGMQSLDPKKRLQPSSYFHATGPAGQVFRVFSNGHSFGRIGVVGLGVGSLACHGTSEQSFTFYEVDPAVERIARDTRFFTFLRECPPQMSVEIGDARISLARAPPSQYDLFVLDAFSSDAIPIHLLTREALQLYLSKLKSDGILLFHISNRYLDLSKVLDQLAASLNLVALIQYDGSVSEVEETEGKSPSLWVVMARERETLAPFLSDARWKLLEGRSRVAPWTDSYSNIWQVLTWN